MFKDALLKSLAGGSPGRFGLRNLFAYMNDPLDLMMRLAERYGDVAEIRMLGERWILLSDPKDIEAAMVKHHAVMRRDSYVEILKRALGNGLLTADGELWKKQRRLAAFAFTPKRIKSYAGAMVDVTDKGIASWRDDEVVSLQAEMSRVTMEVVADVLFGANVGSADVQMVRESMEIINDFFASSPEAVLRAPRWLPTPRNYAMNRAVEEIDSLIYRIIDARRASGEERDDLLGGLLAARDDEGLSMDDQQLRDETVTLFLAGHETTALWLAHTFYLLSKHADIAERVRAEIDAAVGSRLPTREDLDEMPYLEKVLKESMRLYPPAWVTGREVAEDFVLNGRPIAKKTQLLFSQWVVHRDPRFWPNPEAFDPNRWDKDKVKERPRFAYFPFGGGPRICIGNHFAMMEAKLMTAVIASRWELHLLPGERLEHKPSVTLRPKNGGVRVRLKKRPVAQIRDVPAAVATAN